MTERVAAIDIGTNTVLMLVADATPRGLEPVQERFEITRLGEGVDRARRIAEAPAARTLGCLERYAAELGRLGVDRVAAVGTSALRDADGGAQFLRDAERVLGTRPRVIDGELEAALTCQGALSGLSVELASAGSEPEPIVVFDVGGGSTELIETTLTRPRQARCWQSLDVGSVRLTERCFRSDPPEPGELERARALVREALRSWQRPQPARVVGVAGTVTTLSALAQALPRYDSTRVHGSTLPLDRVVTLTERLAQVPTAERARIPALEPGRADVIVAGGLLVAAVLEHLGAESCLVSERGVRWGLAERLASGEW